MKDKRIPTPQPNYFSLFKNINSHLSKAMSSYGIGSTFGSYKWNNPGITCSGAIWNPYNWEGAIPGVPESLLNCERLTPAACKQRSVSLVKSIEGDQLNGWYLGWGCTSI